MAKKWIIARRNPAAEELLRKSLGISLTLARLLVNRGAADPSTARTFLEADLKSLHDPFLMRDMDRAAERILRALRLGEKIFLYGDFDVDGVAGTALIGRFLRQLGADAPYYIPDRFTEGYGLNAEAIRYLKGRGAQLIIAVDCGSTSFDEAELAINLGLDLIVLDHHQLSGPPAAALAVLNPWRTDCPYPFKHLASVGIVFKLIQALRSTLRQEGSWKNALPNLKRHLDLVALGTIADVVPLVGENHILALWGLRELANSGKIGLKALKEVSSIGSGPVDALRVGFALAPRLNAAGRMHKGEEAAELLLTEEAARAAELARLLDSRNRERQAVQDLIYNQAKEMMERGQGRVTDKSIALAGQGWHPGVIGIVASKLVDEFSRPTLLICAGQERCRGSVRSVAGLNIYKVLSLCSDHILGFGGHHYAAGLSVLGSEIDALLARFAQVVDEQLPAEGLIPQLQIDCELSLRDISPAFLREIERLAPFGPSNPQPVFVARGLAADGPLARVGKNGAHLKLRLKQGDRSITAIAFNSACEMELALSSGASFDAAFALALSEWGGLEAVELRLKDLKPSHHGDHRAALYGHD